MNADRGLTSFLFLPQNMQIALLACNGFAPMTLPATPMATRMLQPTMSVETM